MMLLRHTNLPCSILSVLAVAITVIAVVEMTTPQPLRFVQAFTIPSTVPYHSNAARGTRNHITAFLPKETPSFAWGQSSNHHHHHPNERAACCCSAMTLYAAAARMKRIPAELEDVPIPFIDPNETSGSLKFIECYADCTAEINGVEYTVAVPCDYSVSLCIASENDPDELIPIEVTDTELMDDIFPVAESIVAEEYGEDLVLQRTPETLTLVGELELDDEDDEEDDYEEDDDDDEEEVDVLLSFEHRGKEYQLVRIRDPILLVGKKPPSTSDDTTTSMETRLLLTKEESTEIMPTLEDMYLNYQKEQEEEDEDDDSQVVDVDDVIEEKATEDDDALAMTAMDSSDEDDDEEEYVYDDDDEYEDLVTFYDPQAAQTNSLPTIDCFIDRVYEVDGVEYTIGTPCDYVVSICTTEASSEASDDDDDDGELNPIDIEPDTTKIIDELFPIMAKAVADEFDGEMTLSRTPQYMTLLGDIDLDDEDDLDNDDVEETEEYDEDEEDEEVQVILTFDKDGTEYTLVRELEPMLLVGKAPKPEDLNDDLTMDMRILLDAEESDAVVPKLMEMYNDDEDNEDE